MRDGVAVPISPVEFNAWRDATGEIVYPREYEILTAMDDAYCSELNKELEALQEREKERMEQQTGKR